MVTRSPVRDPICLVTYLSENCVLESAAVPTAQRNALHITGRLVVDHGEVPYGLPTKVLQATLKETKAVVEANGGKYPDAPAPPQPWTPIRPPG